MELVVICLFLRGGKKEGGSPVAAGAAPTEGAQNGAAGKDVEMGVVPAGETAAAADAVDNEDGATATTPTANPATAAASAAEAEGAPQDAAAATAV